jgi:hypothetical protein
MDSLSIAFACSDSQASGILPTVRLYDLSKLR